MKSIERGFDAGFRDSGREREISGDIRSLCFMDECPFAGRSMLLAIFGFIFGDEFDRIGAKYMLRSCPVGRNRA